MASLIQVLASDCAAAANGTAEIYSMGTSTLSALVYSDPNAVASSRVTSTTLNAYGSAVRYVNEPVDVIVKDSTGAVVKTFTHTEDARVVRVETSPFSGPSASGNGQVVVGGRTTAASALSQVAISGTTVATGSYGVYNVLSYGANRAGTSSSSTAIAAAIAAAAAAGGGVVYFPAGTYKITAAITVTSANISLVGDGRGWTIIKNYGTATDAITYAPSVTTEMNAVISGLAITTNTTSSGYGIEVVKVQNLVISNVNISGHLVGVGFNYATTNAKSTVHDVQVSVAGVTSSAPSPAEAFYVSCRGVVFRDCYCLGGSTTQESGYVVVGSYNSLDRCFADSFTAGTAYGFQITSNATNVTLIACGGTGNDTDALVASANDTNVNLVGCQFASIQDLSGSASQAPRVNTQTVTSSASSFTVTADFTTTSSAAQTTVLIVSSYSAGAPAGTIANPTNFTYLPAGMVLEFSILKTGANQLNLTWGNKFLDADGLTAFGGLASIAANSAASVRFAVNSSGNLVCLGVGATVAK